MKVTTQITRREDAAAKRWCVLSQSAVIVIPLETGFVLNTFFFLMMAEEEYVQDSGDEEDELQEVNSVNILEYVKGASLHISLTCIVAVLPRHGLTASARDSVSSSRCVSLRIKL